jgi:ADP-heptose:LPS heptosyltransferase
VVLIPGALADHRRWPVENFVEIARRLQECYGWSSVACGGPSETHLGLSLESNGQVPIRNLVGQTSLSGLAALIARARLVVSNETGAAHLAAAVRTPVVCLLGGGHYGRFVPYPEVLRGRIPVPLPVVHPMDCFGCDWHCIHPVAKGMPAPCIQQISVDAVWESLERLIGSIKEQNPMVHSGESDHVHRA